MPIIHYNSADDRNFVGVDYEWDPEDIVLDLTESAVTVFSEVSVDAILAEIGCRSFDFTKDLMELRSIDFKLDAHPEEDVAGFNELYAAVQAHLSRVTSILMKFNSERGVWLRYLNNVKLYIRRERNRILATADTQKLKDLKNKDVIEAWIQQQMPDWFDLRERLESTIADLELAADTAVLKRDELLNANVNMSRQQKAVETLIGLNYVVQARRGQ